MNQYVVYDSINWNVEAISKMSEAAFCDSLTFQSLYSHLAEYERIDALKKAYQYVTGKDAVPDDNTPDESEPKK